MNQINKDIVYIVRWYNFEGVFQNCINVLFKISYRPNQPVFNLEPAFLSPVLEVMTSSNI